MSKKYYLAYGSNLNLEQMAFRCPDAKPIGTINLKDYRLVYKGTTDGHAYLTIEKYEGYTVPLGLYELSIIDILSLDRYEGHPAIYSKYYIKVQIGNEVVKALIYIMNECFDYHTPNKKYISTCIKGYKYFGFDKKILKKALEDTQIEMTKKLKR